MPKISTELLAEMLRDALRQGDETALTVASNSMAPLLKKGDMAHLTQVDPVDLKTGDIIVLTTSSGLLVHRLWEQTEGEFGFRLITKGDRVPGYDPATLSTQLLGRVIARSHDRFTIDLRIFPGRWLHFVLICFVFLENRLTVKHLKSSHSQYNLEEPHLHDSSGQKALSNILYSSSNGLVWLADRIAILLGH